MKFSELADKFYKHNESLGVKSQFGDDDNRLFGVVVFSNENWPDKNYSLENRSYKFASDNKYFVPNTLGSSIFARSLDETDDIRLDWYLADWKIENCYIINNDEQLYENGIPQF